jgi:hypothetical protein
VLLAHRIIVHLLHLHFLLVLGDFVSGDTAADGAKHGVMPGIMAHDSPGGRPRDAAGGISPAGGCRTQPKPKCNHKRKRSNFHLVTQVIEESSRIAQVVPSGHSHAPPRRIASALLQIFSELA